MLTLDGVAQVTDGRRVHLSRDAEPCAASAPTGPRAKRVLIIGGGDGGMAEEVLKHASVDRLTQVEIDQSVVDFSKQHFAEFNAPVFKDDRFNLIIDDGAGFVANTSDRFDVVIVDSTDPVGPGAVLFSAEFYANLHRVLAPGGIAVTQNGVPFFQRDELVGSMRDLSRVFGHVTAYIAAIPTYVGGHMALGFASDDEDAHRRPLDLLQERYAAAPVETRYYTPRGPRRRLRPAALHCRYGGRRPVARLNDGLSTSAT
jgi:spermidine synthase